MSENKPIYSALDELRRLRDEIRVRLRLGEMDVRDWWAEFEPKLEELEDRLDQAGERASGTAQVVSDEIAGALRRIRDRLGEERDQPPA